MIIDCISDLHGHYPKLEGGDLLIVAGDLTARDDDFGYAEFQKWFLSQKYKKKIFIGGNHDNQIQNATFPLYIDGFSEYLCDSGTEFALYPPLEMMEEGKIYERQKVKIWGSPWTLRFEGMNPHCMAFTCETEEELAEKWATIPDDIDILVTHSPPKFGLDKTKNQKNVGSESLTNWVLAHHPRLHIFGHIHESYGMITCEEIQRLNIILFGNINNKLAHTTIVNASHVNERYEPVNRPIRIEL